MNLIFKALLVAQWNLNQKPFDSETDASTACVTFPLSGCFLFNLQKQPKRSKKVQQRE